MTFTFASLQTMGLIPVTRYYRVIKPAKYAVLFKKQRALLYVVVWYLALVGSVPPFFMKNAGFEFQPGKAMCLYTFERNLPYPVFVGLVYIAAPLTVKNLPRQSVLLSVAIEPSFLAPKQPASTQSERGRSKSHQDFSSSSSRFFMLLASYWYNRLHGCRTREIRFSTTGLPYIRVLDLP